LFRGQASALGHRRQFGPHNIEIDDSLADPGAEATIAASDDIVTADEVGVAGDALADGTFGRERRRSCAHLLVDQVETSSTAVAQLAAPWQATTTEL
jgi:hypothetical protein